MPTILEQASQLATVIGVILIIITLNSRFYKNRKLLKRKLYDLIDKDNLSWLVTRTLGLSFDDTVSLIDGEWVLINSPEQNVTVISRNFKLTFNKHFMHQQDEVNSILDLLIKINQDETIFHHIIDCIYPSNISKKSIRYELQSMIDNVTDLLEDAINSRRYQEEIVSKYRRYEDSQDSSDKKDIDDDEILHLQVISIMSLFFYFFQKYVRSINDLYFFDSYLTCLDFPSPAFNEAGDIFDIKSKKLIEGWRKRLLTYK